MFLILHHVSIQSICCSFLVYVPLMLVSSVAKVLPSLPNVIQSTSLTFHRIYHILPVSLIHFFNICSLSYAFKNHVFFVCVRRTHVFIFLSAVFSLLEMFCPIGSWILDSIISLILSRTLHPKASTSLLIVSASQLDLTLNLGFFSKFQV